MDIVNKALPRGNKFYPVDPAICVILESLLKRENIETLRKAKELIQVQGLHSDYWKVCEQTYYWKLAEGSDEYPIITMAGNDLSKLAHYFSNGTDPKKANYTSSIRIRGVNAAYGKQIKVSYCPTRKGLMFYDVPYEGELVSNRPMVINKQLKTILTETINQLALEALIGAGDEDLNITDKVRWASASARAEEAIDLITNVLAGNYDTKDLATCAYALGLYDCKYARNIGYILDLDAKKAAGFTLSAASRTRLIYHYGGYRLPDNYMEWFD